MIYKSKYKKEFLYFKIIIFFFNLLTWHIKKSFPLTKTVGAAETPLTLRSGKGSPIKVEDNTLIFLNDILQVPFESYTFAGGSQVTFSEAPKEGDKVRIYFYRGSENDVVDVDILETIKPGDKLILNQ